MITVKFSRNGCYLPAFGRLGMGDNAGRVYLLPDFYAEAGMLPSSAEILDGMPSDDLQEILEEAAQDKPEKPAADKDELEKAKSAAKAKSAKASADRSTTKAKAPVQEDDVPEDEAPAVQRRSRRRSA